MEKQHEVIEVVTRNLEIAQQRQKKNADCRRSDVQFAAGQMVKLVSSALKRKEHGDVACGKTNAAVLELPGDVSNRKHRTFNVDKLAQWFESEYFPREVSAGVSEAIEELGAQVADETRYIVEAFLDIKKRRAPGRRGNKRWEVLVKWQDYSEEHVGTDVHAEKRPKERISRV